VKWFNFNNALLSPRELQELYVMIFVVIIAVLLFMRPKKSDYRNLFFAWIIFLALLAIGIGFFWFLFYFRIIPYSLGAGFLDQGYWMVLMLIIVVAIQNSFDALTDRLNIKIKKDSFPKVVNKK
jgi:amino acid transporter